MGGYWDWSPEQGAFWVEDAPQPDPFEGAAATQYSDPWNTPYTGWLPTTPQEYMPASNQQYNQWGYGYGNQGQDVNAGLGYSSNWNTPTDGGGGGGTQQQQRQQGGGGGGGGGGWTPPPPPDPYAWMDKFGGKAVFSRFMRSAGENMQKYYARHGGDPVKTVINKFQELQGYAPDSIMKNLAIGALGLGGVIDPDTLDPIYNMPESSYLSRLMKSGPSAAGLTRQRLGGIRTLKGNDWWSMSNALKPWAPEQAASWATVAPVA